MKVTFVPFTLRGAVAAGVLTVAVFGIAATPASAGCAPGQIFITHKVMTCAEAQAWLRSVPTLIKHQQQRIDNGVQMRVENTVGQFQGHVRNNQQAIQKTRRTFYRNASKVVLEEALTYNIKKVALNKFTKNMDPTNAAAVKYLANHTQAVGKLVTGVHNQPGNGGYKAAEFLAKSAYDVGNAAMAVGKTAGKFGSGLYLTTGKIVIGVAAEAGDAHLDIKSYQQDTRLLNQTARKLINDSPAVQLELIRNTENLLRDQVAPRSTPVLQRDLGGILADVRPISERTMTKREVRGLRSRIKSLN